MSGPRRDLNIVAPDGTKGRTGSQRRYIVCRSTVRTWGAQRGKRVVDFFYRTDRLHIAQHESARYASRFLGADAPFIWDTVEGKVVD